MTAMQQKPKFIINSYEGNESYLHKAAKELLYEWLTEDYYSGHTPIDFFDQDSGLKLNITPSDADFIFIEYPITIDFPNLIDEMGECKNKTETEFGSTFGCIYNTYRSKEKYCPCLNCSFFDKSKLLFISDIAIEHKGVIKSVIEICHKHPTQPKKAEKLGEVVGDAIEIDARHILGQITKPKKLFGRRLY